MPEAASAFQSVLDVLAEAVPSLLWIADADGRITYVNSRWIAYTGYTAEHLNASEGGPRGIVHPHDAERTSQLWHRSLRTGEPYEITYRLRSAGDGTYQWFLARAVPVRDADGATTAWVSAATNIDREVRASAGSRFFTEAAAVLSSSLDRKSTMEQFARLAVRLFCDACFVLEREPDGRLRALAMAHHERDVEERFWRFARAMRIPSSAPLAQVLRSHRPLLIRDVREGTDPGFDDDEYRQLIAALRLKSVMIVPLLVAGTMVGTMSFISSDATRLFDARDLDIAVATARQAALALKNARSFERERETTRLFHFLAHVTDQLFSAPGGKPALQRLLDAVVGHMADWATVMIALPRGGFRVEAVGHHDEAKLSLVEELLHQRVFLPETERRMAAQLRHHTAYLTTDIDASVLRSTIQPHVASLYERLGARASVSVPLIVGGRLFGALVAYTTESGRQYSEAEREVFEEIGRRTSLTLERERSSERERHLARTLQEATLPVQLPHISGAVLSTAYFPATTELLVGGDWYDAFELGDGRILFTIGDVTGHGLQASVIMAKLRHYFNVIAMYESDPARILDAGERILLQRYPEAIATAFLAVLDTRNERIAFANAGHPAPLVRLRDGSLIKLDAEGLPLGLRRLGDRPVSHRRTVEDVAVMTFYTDGLIEATRDLEQGERRLRAAVSKDAVLFMRSAANYIATSCQPAKSHDDVALLVLSFPRSVVWTFDADDAGSAHSARKEFIAQLREDASDDSDFAAAELIMGELIGNVVRHAPGPIDIALEWRGPSALLHVIDRGPNFPAKRSRRVDPLCEDGRGLWLIHLLGQGFSVERLPYFGNHVRVMLPVRKRELKEETPRAAGFQELCTARDSNPQPID